MSADLKAYVADAKRFSAMFSGFIKAAEALEGVTSIDQAAKEAESRLNDARRAEADHAASAEARKAAIEQDVAKAGQRLNEAQFNAREIEAQAHRSAAAIRDKANADAEQAQASSRRDLDRARGLVDAALQEHAGIGKQIASAREELDGVHRDIQKARELHARTRAEHEAFVARITTPK